jgi:hypothetical protein
MIWPAGTQSAAAASSQKHELNQTDTNEINLKEKPRLASMNQDKYLDLGNQEQETRTAQPRSKRVNLSLKSHTITTTEVTALLPSFDYWN